LKAGKAIATITFSKNNKLKLNLDWQWLTGERDSGNSEYIEL
jgi:hypothetical protein